MESLRHFIIGISYDRLHAVHTAHTCGTIYDLHQSVWSTHADKMECNEMRLDWGSIDAALCAKHRAAAFCRSNVIAIWNWSEVGTVSVRRHFVDFAMFGIV